MVYILEQLSVKALVNAGYKQSQKAYVQRMDGERMEVHPHITIAPNSFFLLLFKLNYSILLWAPIFL